MKRHISEDDGEPKRVVSGTNRRARKTSSFSPIDSLSALLVQLLDMSYLGSHVRPGERHVSGAQDTDTHSHTEQPDCDRIMMECEAYLQLAGE